MTNLHIRRKFDTRGQNASTSAYAGKVKHLAALKHAVAIGLLPHGPMRRSAADVEVVALFCCIQSFMRIFRPEHEGAVA